MLISISGPAVISIAYFDPPLHVWRSSIYSIIGAMRYTVYTCLPPCRAGLVGGPLGCLLLLGLWCIQHFLPPLLASAASISLPTPPSYRYPPVPLPFPAPGH